MLKKRNIFTGSEMDPDIIPKEAEDFLEIQNHETDLLKFYLESIDFSDQRPADSYTKTEGKNVFSLVFKS
jgi:hypothetical protein